MKVCTRCMATLPLSSFNKKSSHKDGLEYWCAPCHREYKKSYYDNNLDSSRKSRLSYRHNNKIKVNAYTRKYRKLQYKTNLIYRIIKNQRSRLKQMIDSKPTSFSKSLGCTSFELKTYLESKFQPGMTWNNYGQWEIDHIRPLSSFDNLKDIAQFEQAFNYKNLQPLWAEENRRKSDKWEKR